MSYIDINAKKVVSEDIYSRRYKIVDDVNFQERDVQDELDELKNKVAMLEHQMQKAKNDLISRECEIVELLRRLPPAEVPDCVECGETIYSGINGHVEVRKQNGGYEWAVQCDACDFLTFSETFYNYSEK